MVRSVLAFAVVAVGCALDAHPPPAPSAPANISSAPGGGITVAARVQPPPGAAPSAMPLEISAMSGLLGVVEFDAIPYRAASETAPAWDYVAFFVEGDPGVAMVGLVFEGGLDHPSLTPDSRHTFSPHVGSLGDLQVGVLGCSGPDEAVWSFDRFADQVSLVVRKGDAPDQQIIDFTADFVTEGSTVQGSFAYTVAR